ncbi:phage prohead protein [uncultured Actinomyces sp.]|uniref:phage prohead protein n=1 Tax=uncultured Actinomyces sp. TaxID=249061 RepID=UPI0026354C8C|nr:phage prohead protein [uncultured Actinomyces sp.]
MAQRSGRSSSRPVRPSGRIPSQQGKKRSAARPAQVPTSLWVRRIVTGLGLLLIVALLIWGIAKGVSALTKSKETEPQPQRTSAQPTPTATATGAASLKDGETASSDGIVDADGRVRIPACAPADLTVRPSVSDTLVGQTQNVSVAIENRAGVACSFEFGQIDLKILSGDETVYDGSKCQRDRTSATLLLVPGDTWNGGLSWDGGLYSGCTPRDGNSDGATDPAPAGTYRVQLMLDGKTVGDERVFTITQPAPATTEATPAPSESAQS